MNVKNYACKNLHISIHAIVYINMGNKQTVIFCIARSNNWCLIPTASLDVYFSLSLICAQRQFTAPSWNSIRCAGNKVNWVYLCDCIQAFLSIWSPVLTGYFVSERKKKATAMHEMTGSNRSYLFCNSFLFLIMAAYLWVLERLNIFYKKLYRRILLENISWLLSSGSIAEEEVISLM